MRKQSHPSALVAWDGRSALFTHLFRLLLYYSNGASGRINARFHLERLAMPLSG